MTKRPSIAPKLEALLAPKTDMYAPKNPYASINPKDILAATKLDFSIVPETMEADVAIAFLEGALKYGRYNWRMKPVKMSVYTSALKRHAAKLHAGEDRDKKTRVKHVAYIMCCAAIINDAAIYGTLIDDRPPRGRLRPDIADYIDNARDIIIHLQEMFKNYSPKQYTIADQFEDADDTVPPGTTHDSAPQGAVPKRQGTKIKKITIKAKAKRKYTKRG